MNINGINFVCDKCPCFSPPPGCRMDPVANDCDLEDAIGYCHCDKTGGKFYATGFCSEAYTINDRKGEKVGMRKTGRAYRRIQKKKAFMKTLENLNHGSFCCRLARSPESGDHFQFCNNELRKKYFKRVSNKKVRRDQGIVNKGNAYRKVYDLKLELY